MDLYNAGGTSYTQLEREYGVNRSTFSNWVKQLSPIKISEEEIVTLKEYKALQKEIQRLNIENKNILRSDFKAETINQKWCTDITYIHVQKEGWTYLASVMDLCSRKIIGYAYGTFMTAELAVEAVNNA